MPRTHPLPPQALGLPQLGAKLRAQWSEEDEARFALGMEWLLRPADRLCEVKQGLAWVQAFKVKASCLPHKSPSQLQVGPLGALGMCGQGAPAFGWGGRWAANGC